jgi:predicted Rossmann fold nucleotide-binding protein DprA/Smf involved in DNA uptake
MSMSRRTLALALALTPGIGSKTITRILTRNDLYGHTPDEFLKLPAEVLQEEFRLKPQQVLNWTQQMQARTDEAKRMEDDLTPKGVTLMTLADAHYPRRIESLDPDPPGLLYLYGNRRLIESDGFCVLASRGAPEAALRTIERQTEEGVLRGRTLITSHDTPEYQRSAVTALRWGAPRVLCIDTGFMKALGQNLTDEPFAAARLWRYQFDPQTDLVVSLVNPYATFHRNLNRVRDRLVAGLSLSIDLVWVTQGGNMERIGALGVRAGREVSVGDDSPAYEKLRALGVRPLPLSAQGF